LSARGGAYWIQVEEERPRIVVFVADAGVFGDGVIAVVGEGGE